MFALEGQNVRGFGLEMFGTLGVSWSGVRLVSAAEAAKSSLSALQRQGAVFAFGVFKRLLLGCALGFGNFGYFSIFFLGFTSVFIGLLFGF